MSQELFGEAGNVMMSIPNIQPKMTYKMCSSDLQKKRVYPTYNKVYIQPTIIDHPTNKKSSSELQNIFIDTLYGSVFPRKILLPLFP